MSKRIDPLEIIIIGNTSAIEHGLGINW